MVDAETIAVGRGSREENSDACSIYWGIASVASQWKFRKVRRLDQLEHILFALDQMLMAASHILVAEVVSD